MTIKELEDMTDGETANCSSTNATIHKGSLGLYTIRDKYGNAKVCTSAADAANELYQMSNITGSAIVGLPTATLTAGTRTYISGSLTTGMYGSLQGVSMSSEETKRLNDLENELKAHISFEQIKKFKALPRHIRQEIVDDAYIRDLMVEMRDSAHENSFERKSELDTLRLKERNKWNGMYHTGSMVNGWSYPEGSNTKYSAILGKFTTEQLAKAHAEVCLEEDINE